MAVVARITAARHSQPQDAADTLALRRYSTEPHRATGIGWALGVGRVGSILGPTMGGLLLGLGWTAQSLLLTAVVPAIIAATAVLALRRA